ncbi:Gfo/Idh/MocA family protein [Micromonospora sp. LOL_021]|uniref:Gfo/Idh/MocA family protein n=1 Tax=Micromonospora sp. LOL_021 TaxID=3345417 RepID=UPI003A8BBCBF
MVGYGRCGEAHARCYSAMPDAAVVAVVDSTPTRRRIACRHHPHAEIVGSLTELSAEVDLALICTPPSSHETYIEESLLRGVHVFCEKPVFLDPVNGRRLIDLASARARIIFPGHNYLFAPVLNALREQCSPARIGRPQRVEITIDRTRPAPGISDWRPDWRSDRGVAGGGILVDHGAHCVYLTEWLCDRQIRQVSCRIRYGASGIDDWSELRLRLGGGLTATVTLDWRAVSRRTAYRVIGEYGTAAVVLDDQPGVVRGGRDTGAVPAETKNGYTHADWMPEMARDVLRHVVCASDVRTLAAPALTVAEVIAAAYVSAGGGGRWHSVGAHDRARTYQPSQADARWRAIRSGESSP